jgi:aldehyde:ferredoxin oxidoreductase
MDMRRAFNLREGATRKDDTLPQRFMTESVTVQRALRPPIGRVELDTLVTQYYEARGWDPKEGRISEERLVELTA